MIRSLEGRSCLVIGGGGNLGSHIVGQLRERKANVTSFDRVGYGGSAPGVKSILGDICDRQALEAAMQGHSVVIHTASVIDIRPIVSPNMHRTNVEGTRNVVECCKATGVEILVYTSSVEVCSGWSGTSRELPDFIDSDETTVIPEHHCLPYAASKAAAEACVLGANSTQLKTCALRPGYIVGPGCMGIRLEMPNCAARYDYYVTARLPTKMNCVCSHNCALAHVMAAERAAKPGVAGSAFFISDHQANPIDVQMDGLVAAGIKPVMLPLWFAFPMALMMHFTYAFMYRCCQWLGIAFEIPPQIVDIKAMKLAWRNLCFSTKRAREVLDFHIGAPGMKSWEQTSEEARQWSAETYPKVKAALRGKSKAP